MNNTKTALSGYAAAARPIRTDRGAEYAAFARVTSSLKAVDETDESAFAVLSEAVFDNQRLWSALASDLRQDGNSLPVELRVQLLSIAEFVQKHSRAVLRRTETLEALIDVNTSIMRGLRGAQEEAA